MESESARSLDEVICLVLFKTMGTFLFPVFSWNAFIWIIKSLLKVMSLILFSKLDRFMWDVHLCKVKVLLNLIPIFCPMAMVDNLHDTHTQLVVILGIYFQGK